LIGDVDPVVQVFATAVSEIEQSPGLLEKLNEINSQIRFARVFWVSGQVLVESDLIGKTVDPKEFGSACDAVATITDHFGPLIARDFGGKTFFVNQKDEDAATTSEQKESTGLYL